MVSEMRIGVFGLLCFVGLLFMSFPAWAEDPLQGSEVPGICPQPRKTVTAPEDYLRMSNPLEPTSQNVVAGKTLFQFDAQPTACRVCHGIGGDGLGIMFPHVQPKPRNFMCYYTMEGLPDGQLFWVIKNGSPGTVMPSFGYLADDQIWQLILYIRSFSKK